jgi:uncharacterized protein YlxW (UPF0749 family)
MRERLASWRRRRPLLFAVGLTVGFVVVLGLQLRPPDPESRLPGSQRLAALIQRQQRENDVQRKDVDAVRSQIEGVTKDQRSAQEGTASNNDALKSEGELVGMVPVTGNGFTVTLDDSSLSASPTGNINDLVIHSQDVQAVVNGMWTAGAEAIAVNGQRLVSTSAILCVGNTLLLNGTVQAPPYEISAIGADRDRFADDRLVRQLKLDAERYALRYSVGRTQHVTIPAYSGGVSPRYARPVGS